MSMLKLDERRNRQDEQTLENQKELVETETQAKTNTIFIVACLSVVALAVAMSFSTYWDVTMRIAEGVGAVFAVFIFAGIIVFIFKKATFRVAFIVAFLIVIGADVLNKIYDRNTKAKQPRSVQLK